MASRPKPRMPMKPPMASRPRPRVSMKPPVLQIFEDEFHTEKMLGRGSYGDVYAALWNSPKGQVRVAVKFSNREQMEEDSHFDREGEALNCVCNHQNVVDLFGFGDSELKLFVVMELAPFSMDDVLHKLKDPPFIYYADHVMHWALQLVKGIGFIHSQQIIHRNIKPSNLLLFDKGTLLKISDFGETKLLKTRRSTCIGFYTALYIAPEIPPGKPYGNKCDIFSFAITLWEMLTRHRPVLQNKKIEELTIFGYLVLSINGERPPKVQGFPKFICQILDSCWADSPQDRPSAEELVTMFSKICKHFQSGLPLIDPTKPDT